MSGWYRNADGEYETVVASGYNANGDYYETTRTANYYEVAQLYYEQQAASGQATTLETWGGEIIAGIDGAGKFGSSVADAVAEGLPDVGDLGTTFAAGGAGLILGAVAALLLMVVIR